MKLALRIFAAAGVVFAVVTTRVVVSARFELQQGQLLYEAGDIPGAVLHYRRAGRWHAPGNPYSRAALSALARIAREAEAAGDDAQALAAWRSLHAAIASTRSFYVPNADQLAAADAEIARLMSRQLAGDSSVRADIEHELAELPRPHATWTWLLLLGFVVWVTSAFRLASVGFDENQRWRGDANRWVAALVMGFASFVVGLVFA